MFIAWTMGRLFPLNPLLLNNSENTRGKFIKRGTKFRESGHIL